MVEDIAIESVALAEAVQVMIERYLKSASLDKITDLHAMLLEQVEPPLFQAVMLHCRYNQSRAALMLGISRGTLRMKLMRYFDEQFCGHREPKDAE